MRFSVHGSVFLPVLSKWLELGAIGLVCWQLAGLVWGLWAPATIGPMPVAPRLPPPPMGSNAALVGWFSNGAAAGDYGLIAVIAGHNGAAVFKASDGKSLVLRVGDSLDAASRLVAVQPGGVTVAHGALRQEIKLPRAEGALLLARPGGAGKAGDVASVAPPAPTAGLSKAIRLSQGQMLKAMGGGNVAGWDKGLSSAADGGIRIDRVGALPFAMLLHLQDGDILRQVNQRSLDSVADVSRLLSLFRQGPSVDLQVVRNGVSLTQHYEIQP